VDLCVVTYIRTIKHDGTYLKGAHDRGYVYHSDVEK